MNDKINGTCTVDTAEAVYSNWLSLPLREIKSITNMSEASIYRFRVKMADKLKAFLIAAPTAD
ncbi:MAG: hypothetical protein NC184_05360 [Roseburia sp.]|nr:hypothetical protein [Roseburia sp.]